MNTQYFSNKAVAYLFVIAALIFLLAAQVAFAQNSAGIGISPAVVDPAEQFKPGQVGQFVVKISNLSGIDQNYYLSKRNIAGVQAGGVPIFADSSSEVTGYEISDWIKLSAEELFVKAGEEVEYPFEISVPTEVSPGTHFGSIVISVEPPKLRSSGAGVGYEVANIISLRVEGDALESARIRQFSTSKYIYGSTAIDFKVRIENEGNTLIKPVGPLEIVNMFGKRVTTLNFNDSQAGVFPKTSVSDGSREFEISWDDEGPGFGRYEARLSVVYGVEGKMNTISSTATFWILPMNIITPALIVLAVVLLVIYIVVRMYIRRSMSIATSGSTRRLVRSRQKSQFPVLLVIVSMLAVTALFFIVLLLFFA